MFSKARDDGGRPRILCIVVRQVEGITVVFRRSEVALQIIYMLTAAKVDGVQHRRTVDDRLKDN